MKHLITINSRHFSEATLEEEEDKRVSKVEKVTISNRLNKHCHLPLNRPYTILLLIVSGSKPHPDVVRTTLHLLSL